MSPPVRQGPHLAKVYVSRSDLFFTNAFMPDSTHSILQAEEVSASISAEGKLELRQHANEGADRGRGRR